MTAEEAMMGLAGLVCETFNREAIEPPEDPILAVFVVAHPRDRSIPPVGVSLCFDRQTKRWGVHAERTEILDVEAAE